ncbi:MAG: DUF4193 family protein [Comamonadaceae bacterium]|nr:MAG: DUF4193 family protein [Comamonadaceae bacterium]
MSGEELTARVIPKQAGEFTCTSYFLVHHRICLASGAQLICGTAGLRLRTPNIRGPHLRALETYRAPPEVTY